MLAKTGNSKKNVSGSKGVTGGYAFWAPAGTAAPDSIDAQLDEAFENLGFFGEDGASFSEESEFDEIKDANGEVCDKSQSSASASLTVTLIELKKTTQKVQYGDGNVTDEGGVLTVHHKGGEGDHGVIVIDCLLKAGRKMRRVVHDAQRTELGEEKLISPDVFAREATFAIYKDEATGDFITDYIESTETSGE